MDETQPHAALPALLTLIILAVTGAGCAHTQRPESRVYVISADSTGVGGTLLATGGSSARDCQAEHEACFRRCWQKRRPQYPHKHDEWYYERCATDCRTAFVNCEDEEAQARKDRNGLKFVDVDHAVLWIRDHKAEVALGTVVLIAGVAFFITTGGGGALLLAPLAL